MKTQNIQPQSRQSYWWDIILLSIGIGVFFSIFLGSFALFTPDGGRYAEIAREMAVSHNYLVPHLNGVLYFEKPPLFYWLESFSIHLFGLSEWSMRLWPAIFGLSGCLLVYVLGRKFYNRATGILASLMLATSILYFTMSHLISLDMAVAVLISASLVSFLFGAQEQDSKLKKRIYIYLAVICAALAVLTKGLIGVVFPCVIVGAWVLLLNEWCALKSWYLPTSILIFLLLVLPWHILLQIKHPVFWHFYFIEQQFLRYSSMAADRYQPAYYYLGIVLVGFFPWSAFVCQALRDAWPSWALRKQFKVDIFMLLWVGVVLLFFSFSKSKLIPYILPIFPPLAVLTSRYLLKWGAQKTIGITIGFIILLTIAICLSVIMLIAPYYYNVSSSLFTNNFLLRMIAVIILTSFASCFIYIKYRFKFALGVLLFGIAICLPLAVRSINLINHRSVKHMALIINQIKKPGDEVVSFRHYFQDLPFYTRQKVIVVDWINELAFGVSQQDTGAWIISGQEFLRRFKGRERMFVVTYVDDYQNLRKKNPGLKIYLLDRVAEYALFSNFLVNKEKK